MLFQDANLLTTCSIVLEQSRYYAERKTVRKPASNAILRTALASFIRQCRNSMNSLLSLRWEVLVGLSR